MKIRWLLLFVLLLQAAVVGGQTCSSASPCSLFGNATPAGSIISAAKSELGIRFTSDTAGTISGIKFNKSASDTAMTHQVHLWSSSCTSLGSAVTSGETASGWQTATFNSPIPIAASTQYIASFSAGLAIEVNRNYFTTTAANSPPLHGPPIVNGTIAYAAAGTCPANPAYLQSNYWVDPLFVIPGPVVINATLDNGQTKVTTTNQALAQLTNCGNVACTSAVSNGISGALIFTVTVPTPLSITGVSPPSGPIGTTITITGTGFQQGATVTFSNASTGATPGQVTFISSTQLTVTVPQLAAGTYNETVCVPTNPQTCVTHTE